MDIGFIGLGVMGGPMACNLVRAGYRMKVFDIDPERNAPLAALGAEVASSIADAVSGVDFVMTSLPGPKQIRSVTFGPDGVIENMQTGGTWIELSTNNRSTGDDILYALNERGMHGLDAPVSGGSEGAADGTLTVLVGGLEAVFQKALPILQTIGNRIEHVGPHGAGYAAKIAQVVLCYVHSLALSEAMMLGVKGGVPAGKMLDIIENSTGRSYVASRYGPSILDGDYDPSFTLELALKDMRLATELAEFGGADLPLCRLTEDTYEKACDTFGGQSNHLTAVKLLEDQNGTPLRR